MRGEVQGSSFQTPAAVCRSRPLLPGPMPMKKGFWLIAFLAAWPCSPVRASVLNDIGYTRLQAALGPGGATGAGVAVSQIEASTSGAGNPPAYLPDAANGAFTGKTITDVTGGGAISGHATSVGQRFYGNGGSTAPGIDTIHVYEANDWLGGFLFGVANGLPKASSERVANHSYAGATTALADNAAILARVDYLVDRDDYIQVVALNNGSSPKPLLSNSYNAIAVGRTDGHHPRGTMAIDGFYTNGRTRPDLVAPENTTSTATPRVASAAALLVGHGHNHAGLSHGSTTNRKGDIIRNAERSEVIKAALMAGADAGTHNTAGADISDYRAVDHRTANGLDDRYGAGQLDLFNSYRIIDGGEHDGGGDLGTVSSEGLYGFDHGDLAGTGTADYRFTTGGEAAWIKATLAWNLLVDLNASSASLFDLDLFLYDADGALVAQSASARDNTENLWLMLDPNRQYRLRVALADGQATGPDYGLAWRVTAVPLPAAFWLFISALVGFLVIQRRNPREDEEPPPSTRAKRRS